VNAVRVESAKTRASSSTLEWITGFDIFEFGKVAVSAGPFGTVRGLQFAAVFQSFVVGLTVHVALPACRLTAIVRLRQIRSLVFMGLFSKLGLS
jgi:hypothetical protein